jgi:hypothetical protein
MPLISLARSEFLASFQNPFVAQCVIGRGLLMMNYGRRWFRPVLTGGLPLTTALLISKWTAWHVKVLDHTECSMAICRLSRIAEHFGGSVLLVELIRNVMTIDAQGYGSLGETGEWSG